MAEIKLIIVVPPLRFFEVEELVGARGVNISRYIREGVTITKSENESAFVTIVYPSTGKTIISYVSRLGSIKNILHEFSVTITATKTSITLRGEVTVDINIILF